MLGSPADGGGEATKQEAAGPDTQQTADGTREIRMTLDDALDEIGFGPYQTKLLFIFGLAWLSDAAEVMVLSFLGQAIRCDWGASPGEEAGLTTAVFVGMLIGSNVFGALGDSIGRKKTALVSTGIIIFGGLLSAAAPEIVTLLLTRSLVGLGIGGIPTVFALFMEFTPSNARGKYGSLLQGFWMVGTLMESGIAWLVLGTDWAGADGWRWLLVISSLPVVAFTAAVCFADESPRYFLQKGEHAKAQAIVRRVAKANGREDLAQFLVLDATVRSANRPADASPVALEHATASLLDSQPAKASKDATGVLVPQPSAGADAGAPAADAPLVAPQPAGAPASPEHRSRGSSYGTTPGGPRPGGARLVTAEPPAAAGPAQGWHCSVSGPCRFLGGVFWDMGRSMYTVLQPELRYTTLLTWAMWFFNAFGYYGVVLLTTEIVTSGDEDLCQGRAIKLSNQELSEIAFSAAAEGPGLLLAAFLSDWIGRRWSQTGFFFVCAIGLGCLLIPNESKVLQTVLLSVSRGAILGSFTVVYVFTPELYPTHVRAAALGMASAFSRIGGMIAPFVSDAMVELGYEKEAIAVFVLSCLLGGVATLLIRQETAGIQLGSLDKPALPEALADQTARRGSARGAIAEDVAAPCAVELEPPAAAHRHDEHGAGRF